MNTDYAKPSVAPKPRFVCHTSPNWPSPPMSAARGPKPSIAPKPKVTPELNGNQEKSVNGSLLHTHDDAEEEQETEIVFNNAGTNRLPSEKQFSTYIIHPQIGLENVSFQDETTEVKREEEDDAFQKMDEDWRLTDSAVTEEVDSLETLWVSDTGLTADSEDVVEMADTDLTEDMDAEGLDAGEALANTDGVSMGDISVNSIDEEAGGCPAEEHHVKEGQEKVQKNGAETAECTADDLTESLSDDITPLKSIRPDGNSSKRHVSDQDDLTHELHHVCSNDKINREILPRNSKAHEQPERKLLPGGSSLESADKCEQRAENRKMDCTSTEDYVELSKNGSRGLNMNENIVIPCQRRRTLERREPVAQASEILLNGFDCQPRFRLVSISVPTNTECSLTSSLSDSQLLSPNDSDVFGDEEDLDGHIAPFLDDTSDTDQDISDDHVYEEPGHSSEGENVFPFDMRTTGSRSSSLSHHINNNVSEVGVQFLHKPYIPGFGQPAMSSSPVLSSILHKTHNKPHYLSLYPRSISMEGPDTASGVHSYREGSSRQGGAICSSGSFSRCSPLSSSGLSTPTSVVDIPPPFELAYITKRPITKSSPSLFMEGDSSEKNRKKKSSIKRFLMLKFRRKTESKPVVDVSPSSFKASVESSHLTHSRLRDLDRCSTSSSPQLISRSAGKSHFSSEPASTFLFYKDNKRKGNSVAFLNRSVIRMESFEDRSRVPSTSLPLTKPRSISFPNTDTSDYENVPAISSDYENLQVPQWRPVRQAPFTDFFDRPSRVLSAANETDGYVDMSSLPGFKSKTQPSEQETESAYTEAYNVCLVAVPPQTASMGDVREETAGEEDQGHTSEEEEGGADSNYDRQPDGRSRAFYIAKELVDTERLHVKALKLLQEDFREAVGAAVGDEGDPVLDEERLREILNELPDVYTLHRRILNELENRIRHWEESQRIADIILSRKAEFLVFTTYIGHYDRSMSLLEDSCRTSPAFAAIVHQFEQSPAGEKVSLKQQLLQVIVRVAQYRMLLTDYLNNLSPDSQEYEDTQAAVVVVSDIADQANDSLKHGENLLRLVNIEYSVLGQRDLLQPGRVFVKEGTLMKVSRKSRQPRHLFLMNDVLLYTYPQQDGKYRLKNTLHLTGLKISKPVIENVQNALRIEGADISITLSASSFIEREDWFYTLSRSVAEHARGSTAFNNVGLGETRDGLRLFLGEKAPTLVPVSQVMMCMNCTSDFSLTLRRHHCYSCGRIVCRSCSKNRYPLKYMNNRMAKVCDYCYNELKKRGDDLSTLSGKGSPRPNRSSRPLSAVFQNIHPPNIWRHRKGNASFTQVTVSEEGSISGSLQCSKKSKRSWKKLWFLLKDKVLYTYRGQEEKVASESLPLLGFTVKLPDRQEGEEEANIFQLYHKKTLYYTFKASDNYTARRWVNAMEEATVL
ncbi:FYVE, RhoGEF and PH domain-containing protein 5b isoform X2 [Halichoeres trimaculatus]|uniref:FYVE, RhoGEF and PH domain-containing protein 5b isoform X2 n=1 Tax=Halichoeres trimaculatus TaxID=147232 RepID=UPI003D9E3D41